MLPRHYRITKCGIIAAWAPCYFLLQAELVDIHAQIPVLLSPALYDEALLIHLPHMATLGGPMQHSRSTTPSSGPTAPHGLWGFRGKTVHVPQVRLTSLSHKSVSKSETS